jgi:hypothetical protein
VYVSVNGKSFSITALTKKLWPKRAEIFMESDSDAYVEDEGRKTLEE